MKRLSLYEHVVQVAKWLKKASLINLTSSNFCAIVIKYGDVKFLCQASLLSNSLPSIYHAYWVITEGLTLVV